MKVFLVLLMLLCVMPVGSQSLSQRVGYRAVASCSGPDAQKPLAKDKYYYRLDILNMDTGSEDFEILLNGERIVQFNLTTSELPYTRYIGPFHHSGIGGTFNEFTLRALGSGAQDVLFLQEVICGYSTDNGFNRAGYYCSPDEKGLIAQAAPEAQTKSALPDKVYVYALVDAVSKRIVDKNFSGHFSGLADYSGYEIHAMATTFDDSDEFVSNIVIGSILDQSSLEICYALCGIYKASIDCSSFDLELSKNVQNGVVHVYGDTVIFNIAVYNAGSITAYNVIVQDHIPFGLSLLPSINPEWNPDGTSKKIDSVSVGQTVTIPIRFLLERQSGIITIRNIAEIISGSSHPDKDIPAFDVDSTPDNKDDAEDDQDGDEITVLENLCRASFKMNMSHLPVCLDKPIKLAAIVEKASFPVKYYWRFKGNLISTDSVYTIALHDPSTYGKYSLTIVDANGCSSTQEINLEPILDEQFTCTNDIIIGADELCRLQIDPSLFIPDHISGRDNYVMDVRDEKGNVVSLQDLRTYPSGTVFSIRFINPCNMRIVCWSNLHLEYKFDPKLNHYRDTSFISCALLTGESSASQVIKNFNENFEPDIWSAARFSDSLEAKYCFSNWEVQAKDQWVFEGPMCSNPIAARIYFVRIGNKTLYLDTAYLEVLALSANDILFPPNVSNLSCSVMALDSSFFPYVMVQGKKVDWNQFQSLNSSETSKQLCGVSIKYNDDLTLASCAFGTNKILRRWSATDWCNTQIIEKLQYIYRIDDVKPEIVIPLDTIRLIAKSDACKAELDLNGYVLVEDNCDPNPSWQIIDYFNVRETILSELPIGLTHLTIKAKDACGNTRESKLVISVVDQTPPVAILKRDLSVSFDHDQSVNGSFILSEFLDAGSHDSGCGPVKIEIARSSELQLLENAGGTFPVSAELYNCGDNLALFDINKDELITAEELFRDRINFCCQDVGKEISIAVRISDVSGNVSLAMVTVFVSSKAEVKLCDDLDPCTIDDRQIGSCPCQGTPDLEDIDKDGILDCSDLSIQMCLNGQNLNVERSKIDSLIGLGAIPGQCVNPLYASIGGEIYTLKGEMIESVLVNNSGTAFDTTDSKGGYVFHQNPMYANYELIPYKNDDPHNGLSVLDLVLLQEIILGLQSPADPYLLIAADLTNDGRISALDLAELRKILLGLQSGFSSNTSWRFVTEKYFLANPTQVSGFEEINHISDLDGDRMHENWIGIKLGDLSQDAKANSSSAGKRSYNKVNISASDRFVQQGNEIELPLYLNYDETIKALQLSFVSEDLQFVGIKSNGLELLADQFSISAPRRDRLDIIWSNPNGKKCSAAMFTLVLRAAKDIYLSKSLHLSGMLNKNLIVSSANEELSMELSFIDPVHHTQDDKLISLHQNQPNPFIQRTLIQFELYEAGEVELIFYDVTGQLLYKIQSKYGKGLNAVYVKDEELKNVQGIIYYQLKFKGQSVTRTMLSGIR